MPISSDEWRHLRKERGLSVRELSELTGLSQSTIEKLEFGGQVTRSTRTLVAAALGLPVFENGGPA